MRLIRISILVLAAAMPLLTGCHQWNAVYDPAPLTGPPVSGESAVAPVGYLDHAVPVGQDAATCSSCDSAPKWHRYTIWGRIRHAATCGSGCGEWYWGEWCYDPPPPKGCDACDMDGHFVGKQPCAECGGILGWLRGRRVCHHGCNVPCGDPGCDAPAVSAVGEPALPRDH